MGTPDTCKTMIDSLKEAGVDEIAALIDFGVEFDWVMESLHHLKEIKDSYASSHAAKLLVN